MLNNAACTGCSLQGVSFLVVIYSFFCVISSQVRIFSALLHLKMAASRPVVCS